MSGEVFRAITVRLASSITSVLRGARNRSGAFAMPCSGPHPSSTASRRSRSNRPERFDAAPRPRRASAGVSEVGSIPSRSDKGSAP